MYRADIFICWKKLKTIGYPPFVLTDWGIIGECISISIKKRNKWIAQVTASKNCCEMTYYLLIFYAT